VPSQFPSNRWVLVSLLFFLQIVSTSSLQGQSVALRQVKVSSHWGGLGTPADSELTFVKQGADFRWGHKKLEPDLLDNLVSALKEPEVSEPSLNGLGITHEWLVKNHDGPLSRYQGGPEIGAPNQKALYQQRFEDEAFITKQLSTIYKSGFHTDDFPSVRVELDFEDGTVVTAVSRSQQPYMLPWQVEKAGAKIATYNARISRALAAVLPNKTVNRYRISGDGLLDVLRTTVERAIEPELNSLDANNRAALAIETLRGRYAISEAEIDEFHHVEYGTQWTGNQPHEANLHVSLKRSDLPPNLIDAVVLEYKDDRVEGAENVLREMGKYESLVLSVRWLSDYLRAHEKVPIRISFVHDASLGKKALKTFVDDMSALGNEKLVNEINEKRAEVALLITGIKYAESYWLLMPDKRMILWRYNGPSGLLKWKASDFHTSECADYGVPFGGCVGAVIDVDGNLAP